MDFRDTYKLLQIDGVFRNFVGKTMWFHWIENVSQSQN